MTSVPRTKIADFIDNLYDGDLHAKRVLSLANATLGVLVSASLAVHAIGQGLAQALSQVDRLLQPGNRWDFGYWIPTHAMDWTSRARSARHGEVVGPEGADEAL